MLSSISRHDSSDRFGVLVKIQSELMLELINL